MSVSYTLLVVVVDVVVTVVAGEIAVALDTTVVTLPRIWFAVVAIITALFVGTIVCPFAVISTLTWSPSLMMTASCGNCGFTLRLVRDPELAALRPRPIFARRLLSEPVFFSKSGGAGGTVVRPAAFLCSCCNRAYCSCRAFCFLRSS